MGNSEEAKSAKTEKSPPPVTTDQANQMANQPNVHVYPDWTAMQAYYGPRVNMPPYYNGAVANGHPPHPFMWGPPQHMMPPYGPPYAAIYSHGGVYPHPAVAIGPQAQGVPLSPAGGTPPSVETPTKLSGNTDQGLMKKLKGFDGLAMSIGNGNVAESAERGAENRLSQSADTEGSSDGSDGNTAGTDQSRRKRSRDGTPTTTDGEGKTETQDGPISKETSAPHKMMLATPAGVAGKLAGPVVSSGITTALELMNPSPLNSRPNSSNSLQPCGVIPSSETWLQRELKRERRKQSNRESARRSRLRKQAETEELARKVDNLTAENVSLKSEINQLTGNSDKLRVENATLKEKLKNAHLGRTEEMILNGADTGNRVAPVSTENLLSRVNNSSSEGGTAAEDNGFCENKSKSGAKLHQLMDKNPRADAVAAV